jgi:hypothetical protein
MNDQKPCLGEVKAETNKVQEMLDLSRSHTGRAVGLFVALGILPGVSWHDAAIAAASVSIYAFWVRCEANAEPGETGADVLARRSADWAKEVTQVAAAIAAFRL